MNTIPPENALYLLEYLRCLARRAQISERSLARIEDGIRIAGGMDSTTSTGPLQKPEYFFLPGLTHRPFWEPSQFEWVTRLEAHYETIKRELMQLRNDSLFGPHPQADLIEEGVWAEYHFFDGDKKLEENCARCPETTAVIESIVEGTSCGLKYFSAHAPGTLIKPHCGPHNARLRCHLGLCIPDDCALRVGTETQSWQEGKCLVFDDSFLHEAWNTSNRTRIVLLIDFSHPDLTQIEIAFLGRLWKAVQQMQDEADRDRRVKLLQHSRRLSLPQGWWV